MIFSAWAISAVVWPPWIIAWPYIEGGRTVPENECYIQFIYRYAMANKIINLIYICKWFIWWETKRNIDTIYFF